MLTIVYIHGSGASRESFNYIRSELRAPLRKEICLEYENSNGFFNNLEVMKSRLLLEDNLFFVAHSLGGLYALHLADSLQKTGRVLGGITLATPYGGCEAAGLLSLISPIQLYRDIMVTATPVVCGFGINLTVPWTAIVTTKGGASWINEPNDGVVTYKSMKFRKGVDFVEVSSTHNEILQAEEAIKAIRSCMNRAEYFYETRSFEPSELTLAA